MLTETIPFQVRTYADDSDLAIIADIMNICDAHDQLEESVTVQELREEYSDPRFNPQENLFIWYSTDGTPAAFSEHHVPHGSAEELAEPGLFVFYKIIPAARGLGLEGQLLDKGDQRRRLAEQELGKPVRLEAMARDVEVERAETLESLGFRPFRYFLRMARLITSELPVPTFPTGFAVRAGELSDAEYVTLRNEIWVDHFGYQPWIEADVRHYRELSDYDPNLDLIAYDAQGQPAAFCWGHINAEENARTGRNDGWIGLLGVRRAYRNLGLGQALLREGMHRLRAAGADYARLGVDGASPTGATRLYAAEGFETVFTRALYERD